MSHTTAIPPLYQHQEATATFGFTHQRVLDTSDPGTGKTRGTLEAYWRRKKSSDTPYEVGRLLVVAPLSILEPSWGDDIQTFFPELKFSIATQPHKNRMQAFMTNTDVVIINTDGVKWVDQNQGVLKGFTDLCVDEFSAFKNRTTGRTRALSRVSKHFAHITMLSGTPIESSLQDIWAPVFILDRGKRLGTAFSKYRLAVAKPVQNGPQPQHIKWVDKPGAAAVVSTALSDISLRHVFEECIDIPEHTQRYMYVDLSTKSRRAYDEMKKDAVLFTESGELVTAVNAAVKVGKLLQIISGAVYDAESNPVYIDNTRYDLVMELVHERPHSIVGFTWQHEKEALIKAAKKEKLPIAWIDGTVPFSKRGQIIADYQAGKYRALLCHPKSAAHGLTLTRGTTTIWCSATNSSEAFKQLNQRIYRAGQTQKTETIMICARGTREQEVYESLKSKLERVGDLLGLLTGHYEANRPDD